MSYDTISGVLEANRNRITNEPVYKQIIRDYKTEVKTYFSRVATEWDRQADKLNKTFGTKIVDIHMGAIKFCELFSMMDEPIKEVMFVGELPGGAFLMCRLLYPRAYIRLNSPLPKQTLFANKKKKELGDTFGLNVLKEWFEHKEPYIENEDFKSTLKHSTEIPSGWLISDIGTEFEQYKIQKTVLTSILDILRNETNKIGRKGLIIKIYRFYQDEITKLIYEISKFYQTFDMVKPQGSSIANDEIYLLFKNKQIKEVIEYAITGEKENVPNAIPMSLEAIDKERLTSFYKTVDFYEDYMRSPSSVEIDEKIITQTVRFAEAQIEQQKND